MEIPDGPESITLEWLTEALRQNGAVTQASILSFQTQPIGADGEGITGQTARLQLTYDFQEPGVPQTLIAKFHSADLQTRTIANSLGMYEREFRFYQYGARQTGLPTPHCYYGDFQASGMTVLLLEDLAPAKSPGSVLTPAQVEMVIQQIARFHAFWWEHPQLADILGPDYPDALQNLLAMLQQAVQEKWELVVRLAGDNLPQPMRAIGQKIVNNWAAIGSRLRLQSPRTLIHGDFGGDNLFFPTLQDGNAFSVIDWQLSSRGRGPHDVGMLVGSLPTEQRQKSEMDLLKMYHQILEENAVRGYSFEQCLDDYRFTMLDSFARLVYVIREPFPGEDLKRFQANDHKLREVELPRRCAAILDLDADTLIMG